MKLVKKPKKDKPSVEEKKRRREEQAERQEYFEQGIVSLLDFIAPASLNFSSSHFHLGLQYARSAYVIGYPREVLTGWLGRLISLPETLDISFYIEPVDTAVVLRNLTHKSSQVQASIAIDQERNKVRDPAKEAEIADIEEIRDKLQVGEEKFFRLGFYYTVYAPDLEDLNIAP